MNGNYHVFNVETAHCYLLLYFVLIGFNRQFWMQVYVRGNFST